MILDPDSSRAEEKYRELFEHLVRYFEWKRILTPDDLAQETLKRGFARLQEGAKITTENPAAFFFGIARNLVRESWRNPRLEQLEESDWEAASADKTSRHLHGSEQTVLLRECLQKLSEGEFNMLRAYLDGEGEVWAQKAGISLNALHARVHRLRRQLERSVNFPTTASTAPPKNEKK